MRQTHPKAPGASRAQGQVQGAAPLQSGAGGHPHAHAQFGPDGKPRPMVRLVYRSQARVDFSGPLLGALNVASQRKNAPGRISGLLLNHQGHFFGVVEGVRPAVEACMRRVARDQRHGDITVLSNSKIRVRAFEGWRMGVAAPDDVPAALRHGMFSIAELLPPDSALRGDVPEVRAQVRTFLAGFATLMPEPLQRVG